MCVIWLLPNVYASTYLLFFFFFLKFIGYKCGSKAWERIEPAALELRYLDIQILSCKVVCF